MSMHKFCDLLRRLIGGFIGFLLSTLPAARLQTLIADLVNRRISRMAPDEGLRFLFRLDAALYRMVGRLAEHYGEGVHVKHRLTRYHDFFVDRLNRTERVLEVGCGAGDLAHDVAMRVGCSVTALEIDGGKIDIAKSRFSGSSVCWLVGDATQNLPGERFDVVIMSNLLEHLTGRGSFLRRVVDVTGAERFLFRVPLFERDWRVPLKKELGVEWRLDPTHETEYTVESFAEEMVEAGLVIIHQEVHWGEIWAEAIPMKQGNR